VLRTGSGKNFDSKTLCAGVAGRGEKISESPVKRAVSINSAGSLTIVETGGDGAVKIVLVFYDPEVYSEKLWQE
jgi:hypothetical protein